MIIAKRYTNISIVVWTDVSSVKRHRFVDMNPTKLVLGLTIFACCGGSGRMAVGAVTPTTVPRTSTVVKRSVVIVTSLSIEVNSVSSLIQTTGDYLESLGGYVANEENTDSETGSMSIRVPSKELPTLLGWLDEQGIVSNRKTSATDVSKELFDHNLALVSLKKTLTRMQQLLERPDLDIEAVLKIEAEMDRLRTEIERIQGQLRFVSSRVALATLNIDVRSDEQVTSEKFRTGVRMSHMRLLAPGSRSANRFGLGLSIRVPNIDQLANSPVSRLTYSLDVFDAVDGEKKVVIATFGADVYSSLFGDGKKRFFNPYLGGRLGYARLEGPNFVLTGEAGVEVVKTKYLTFEVNTQLTSFFGKGGPDVALVSGAEFSLAF